MALLDEANDTGTGRRTRRVALVAALALAVLAVGIWFAARPAERRKGPVAVPRAGTTPRATRPPVPKASPARSPLPEALPEAPGPTLRVDADVRGANVFLDRKFLGTTPVETRGFEPGTHRLNVSAEGYDMYAETLELSPSANEVHVRFKEVRLDERVDVVHKHGVGSCRGRLVATTAGLRYESDKPADSFEAGFDRLGPLEVAYLDRSLRVKQPGGKTWNFTADSADALLAFQKAVEKARQRLRASS
jgi:PEGA domain